MEYLGVLLGGEEGRGNEGLRRRRHLVRPQLLPTGCNLRTTTSQKCAALQGGLVFKAHRLCVLLNSRLGSNTEEEEVCVRLSWPGFGCPGQGWGGGGEEEYLDEARESGHADLWRQLLKRPASRFAI